MDTLKPRTDTSLPELVWHLHGHYNQHSDAQIQSKCLEVFAELSEYLGSRGHQLLVVAKRDYQNGPHLPGSWDIFVRNSAIGDATVWMSLKRPEGVPVFYHPVLRDPTVQPTAKQEFVAHTRAAFVFGLPADASPESAAIDWNDQLDWNWVAEHWGPQNWK